MEEKKLTDEQDNLIIEFDGYGFAPTITMPNTEEYAIEWKKRLIRVFSSQNAEIERQNKEYIELDLEARELRTELVKEIADHEEFTKKANEEIERLTEENEYLDMCGKQFLADYQKCEVERAELENQVNELKKERENVQKILYELGKCGNDKERYAVWVKLIKYCGVEVE